MQNIGNKNEKLIPSRIKGVTERKVDTDNFMRQKNKVMARKVVPELFRLCSSVLSCRPPRT